MEIEKSSLLNNNHQARSIKDYNIKIGEIIKEISKTCHPVNLLVKLSDLLEDIEMNIDVSSDDLENLFIMFLDSIK